MAAIYGIQLLPQVLLLTLSRCDKISKLFYWDQIPYGISLCTRTERLFLFLLDPDELTKF